MMVQNLFSRVPAVLLSASIHVALGWALFVTVISGVRTPAHSDGVDDHVLVIEMIPLDRIGVHGTHGDAVPRGDDGKHVVQRSRSEIGMAAQRPVMRATSAATMVATDSGSAPPTATPALTDLPSTDVAAYRLLLQTHLAHYRLYPALAQAAGDQGVVSLHFIMDREGRVSDAWIETSSGIASIDREALEAVARAQPMPPLPAGWPDRLDISLPVRFKLG